tara:strand:- start:2710 stop:3111 length:402 start_codon:yes stop_codon:yes gene_type:complete
MTFLSRWIIVSSLFLSGCAGATMFVSATSGGILSKYISENIDFKEVQAVDVKIVKLLSGEELIGMFDEETYTIKNPVVMIPVNNEKIAFSPWMPYSADKEFQLKEEQVSVIAAPSKTITNEYNRAFGSGIVVP